MNILATVIYLSLFLISLRGVYMAWIYPKRFIDNEVRYREKLIGTSIGKLLRLRRIDPKRYNSIVLANRIVGVLVVLLCLIGIVYSFIST